MKAQHYEVGVSTKARQTIAAADRTDSSIECVALTDSYP